jgi:hypothetical protein
MSYKVDGHFNIHNTHLLVYYEHNLYIYMNVNISHIADKGHLKSRGYKPVIK